MAETIAFTLKRPPHTRSNHRCRLLVAVTKDETMHGAGIMLLMVPVVQRAIADALAHGSPVTDTLDPVRNHIEITQLGSQPVTRHDAERVAGKLRSLIAERLGEQYHIQIVNDVRN